MHCPYSHVDSLPSGNTFIGLVIVTMVTLSINVYVIRYHVSSQHDDIRKMFENFAPSIAIVTNAARYLCPAYLRNVTLSLFTRLLSSFAINLASPWLLAAVVYSWISTSVQLSSTGTEMWSSFSDRNRGLWASCELSKCDVTSLNPGMLCIRQAVQAVETKS